MGAVSPAARAIALVALLIMGGLGPAAATPAVPQASTQMDPRLLEVVAPWLKLALDDVEDPLLGLDVWSLAGTAGVPDDPRFEDGWAAYFSASGLEPTADELAAIRAFQLSSPSTASLVEDLAGEVASARALRDAAFDGLSPGQSARLPEIVGKLLAGDLDALTPEERATIGAVDIDRMTRAAQALEAKALASKEGFAKAASLDSDLERLFPEAARIAARDQDLHAILSTATAEGNPVTAAGDFSTTLIALELLSGQSAVGGAPGPMPPHLAAPLSNLLTAKARAIAQPSVQADADLAATFAASISPLVRASYNLSLASHAVRESLAPGYDALDWTTGDATPQRVLANLTGAKANAAPVPFPQGVEALHACLATPFTDAMRARAQAASAALGDDLALALGRLVAAQAHLCTLSQSQASQALALEGMRPAIDAILASGDPLESDEIALLRRAAEEQGTMRASHGDALATILESADALAEAGSTNLTVADGVVYDDGAILVLDGQSSLVTEERFPGEYVLVLDLGGDDLYTLPLAGVDGRSPGVGLHASAARSSVAIDLGGDDRYAPTRNVTLGAAVGTPLAPALGLLLDARGNDVYAAPARSLAWTVDGVGVVIDQAGADAYANTEGDMVAANTTDLHALGIAMLLDAGGADEYRSAGGFAALMNQTSTSLTLAAFVEAAGDDRYFGDCPRRADVACFGTPRWSEEIRDGTIVFLDMGGEDRYPRSTDPIATFDPGVGSMILVEDSNQATNLGEEPPAEAPADGDGDRLPDDVEGAVGSDPRDPNSPSTSLADTDGDGFVDAIEIALQTDPADASSYPVGVPKPPDPVPDVFGELPLQGESTMMLNLPGVIAIGTSGTTTYQRYYPLIIDLGFTADERDVYLNATALNGFALDLGGNDHYEPQAIGGVVPPALGVVSDMARLASRAETGEREVDAVENESTDTQLRPLGLADPIMLADPVTLAGRWAMLVDLGGDDVYRGGSLSLGAATTRGFALALDVDGNDEYVAPGIGLGHAARDGVGWFLDLAGNDKYRASSAGTLATQTETPLVPSDADSLTRETMPGTPVDGTGIAGLFVDAAGDDVYDITVTPGDPGAQIDRRLGRALTPIAAVDDDPLAVFAAFLDLAGTDTYLARSDAANVADASASRRDLLRVDPLDRGGDGVLEIFLDLGKAPPSDRDGDGYDDAAETAAGTDPASRDDSVGAREGFRLSLPRLGIAVGADVPTVYPAGEDFALVVDLGGNDSYAGRPGATSPRFPVSLLIDLVGVDGYGKDTYRSLSSNLLSEWSTTSASRTDPSSGTLGETYVDALYAGAQGAGILGVGVLVDAGGQDTFEVILTDACAACIPPTILAGASQGAGVLGVGVLAISGKGNDSFLTVVSAEGRGKFPSLAVVRTHSQGVGIAGVGILHKEDPLANDTYELRAMARAPGSDVATTGQGYGLRGIGIAMDAGGANLFLAGELAQGVADGGSSRPGTASPLSLFRDPGSAEGRPAERTMDALAEEGRSVTTAIPPQASLPWRVEDGIGLLLLPGVGDDLLVAQGRSQGYGVAGGMGALLDSEGDDVRYLEPSLLGRALGQGAGTDAGTGFLFDHRGNDLYVVNGSGGQAYGDQGFGVLFDASGSDRYQARREAQGMAVASILPPAPEREQAFVSAGVLVERTGNDVYALDPGMPGQGSVIGSPLASAAFAVGAFIELGGVDHYDSSPPVGLRYDNADWSDGAVIGVDASQATDAWASVFGLAPVAELDPYHEGAKWTGDIAGPIELRTRLARESGLSAGDTDFIVDRAEFYDDGRYLAPADLQDDFYNTTWNTSALTEAGDPAVPDGVHAIEGRIYGRVGAPELADVSEDVPAETAEEAEARRVAVDLEPVIVTKSLAVDNPPLIRVPVVPTTASAALGRIPISLRVDRDLEGGCVECNEVALQPGRDEWALPWMDDPGLIAKNDTMCACKVTVDLRAAAGKAYLTWAPVTDDPIGYRVYRRHVSESGVSYELAGYVDARVEPRVLPGSATPRLWFIDHSPGGAQAYAVAPLRTPPTGEVLEVMPKTPRAYTPSEAPGPATGLVARGVEGKIVLSWNAAPGATGYRVVRSGSGIVGTPTSTWWEDKTVQPDVEYTYTVTATSFQGISPIQSMPVTAKASPGHNVSMRLLGLSDWILLQEPLGGDTTHTILWDATGVPDGDYTLESTQTDWNDKANTSSTTMQIDSTAPATTIGLPHLVGTSFLTGSALRIPFDAHETGSGGEQTAVYAKVGDAPWPQRPVIVNASAGEVVFNNPKDGEVVSILAISSDKAGNIEGLDVLPPWPATLQDAFEPMAAARRYTTHTLDLSPPGGEPSGLRFDVKPGDVIPLWVIGSDRGSGIMSATALINGSRTTLSSSGTSNYTGSWYAEGPGEHQIVAEFMDGAGNFGSVLIGTVTVDATPPRVDEAVVGFSGGRAVGRTGEIGTLRVRADDDLTGEGKLIVEADVSNVSTLAQVRATFDEDARLYLATFPINRLGTVETTTIGLTVRDLAGNAVHGHLPVEVNGTPATMGEPTLVVGTEKATIAWTTIDSVRGRVDYGQGPQLAEGRVEGPRGTVHNLTLEGLRPDTRYFAKRIATSDANVETHSDFIEFRTRPAFDVTAKPGVGFPHTRREATLLADVVRFDGKPSAADLSVVLVPPRGLPREIASATAEGRLTPVTIDLRGLRDGTYSLHLVAEEDGFRVTSSPIEVTLDTTPPILTIDPTTALGATARVRVELDERGSGIDVASAVAYVAKKVCPVSSIDDVLVCIPFNVASNATSIEVEFVVPDRAGNVAHAKAVLPWTGGTPVVGDVVIRDLDGVSKIRPGSEAIVAVNMTDDAALVARIDLASISDADVLTLKRTADTMRTATFRTRSDLAPGLMSVDLVVERDNAPALRRTVNLSVDTTPPRVMWSALERQGPDILVRLRTDEPTRIEARTAGASAAAVASDQGLALDHLLRLPSAAAERLPTISLRVRDAAGHESLVLVDPAESDTQPPKAPADVAAIDVGSGRIGLHWSPAEDDTGVASYRVMRKPIPDGPVAILMATGTSFIDEPEAGTDAFTYQVAAVDLAGRVGPAAHAVSVTRTALPSLVETTVSPAVSGPGPYRFAMALRGVEDPALLDADVIVDGVRRPLQVESGCNADACTFATSVVLAATTFLQGDHTHHFTLARGSAQLRVPSTGEILGPVVIAGEPRAIDQVIPGASRVPDIGLGLSILALVAASLVLGVGWRRKTRNADRDGRTIEEDRRRP